ncbi:hypothetical protein FB384_002773 [Prauserella sediminis]|uniref:Gram-positive cocci surface proteins LPxTG domain-containing protein n=1 Tax=Prauserella sediminis TaxID=577680 RepID=A0A839XPP2_9PSEU|nr:hypothetical protein [Prauserella sediminis]MBB3663869.1 hypothetical protein [Prauserella sediminis]
MSVGPRFRLRALVTSAMALGVLAGSMPLAAAHDKPEKDPRAVAVDGNVDEGMKRACEQAGFDGEPIDKADVGFTGGPAETFLTITEVPAGVEVTGILVKGGPAYNLYEPGERGLPQDPAWEKLRSPLNNGGKIAAISHWFLCGTGVPTETTTPPGSTPPPDTTTPPESTTPSESTTPPETTTTGTDTTSPEPDSTGPSSTTSNAGAATTTSQPAVAPAGDTDDLASTGFGAGWLLGLGALLLAGGGALVTLTRKRRTTS